MNSRKVFGTLTCLCAILVLASSSAITLGQDDPAAYRLITGDGEGSASSFAEMPDAPSGYFGGCDQGCGQGCYQDCCRPWWSATADVLIWDRIGWKTQTIVPLLYDGEDGEVTAAQRSDLLNSDDFTFGFRAGPRFSLVRHGCRGYDLEFVYFGIDGWSDTQIVPASETFLDYDLRYDLSSRLYNAEANLRWNPLCRVALLAGFRWSKLREELRAGYIIDSSFEPVGNLETDNNLYGFQIGTDAILLQRGCFSVNGLLKAGIYGNHAELTSTVLSGERTLLYSTSTNHTAFIGEVGLQGSYQVTDCLSLKAGYTVLWIDGVALPTSQLADGPGIDSSNTVIYHGATAGLEYRF